MGEKPEKKATKKPRKSRKSRKSRKPKEFKCDICGATFAGKGGYYQISDVVVPLFGMALTGRCCEACKIRMAEYAKDSNLDLLPDGLMKTQLRGVKRVQSGLRSLEILGWLAEHLGTVHFRNSDMVAGKPADEVEVVTATRQSTGPTLEVAMQELLMKGGGR